MSISVLYVVAQLRRKGSKGRGRRGGVGDLLGAENLDAFEAKMSASLICRFSHCFANLSALQDSRYQRAVRDGRCCCISLL